MTTASLSDDSLRSISDVAGYIAQRNAETTARCESEGITFYTVIPDSPEWAAKFTTAYDMELYYAQAGWFEVFRDVRGYKPRGVGAPSTLEDCRKAEAALFAEVEANDRWEVEQAVRDEAEQSRVAAVTAEAMNGTPLTSKPFAGLFAGLLD